MKKTIEINVGNEIEAQLALDQLRAFNVQVKETYLTKMMVLTLLGFLLSLFLLHKYVNPSALHLGSEETVFIGNNKEIKFLAKVDSGAETSSIHAINIKLVTKDGQQLVQYTTVDDSGKSINQESILSRIGTVKSASGISQRYFVLQMIWLGNKSYLAEVNLADRTQLSKKMLIGKNIIKMGYLINAKKRFLASK